MNNSMLMEICSKKYNSINCPDYLYTDDKTLYDMKDNEYLGRFYDGYKFHVVKYKIIYEEDCTCYYFNLNKKEMVIYHNNSNGKTCIGKIIHVKYLYGNVLHTTSLVK